MTVHRDELQVKIQELLDKEPTLTIREIADELRHCQQVVSDTMKAMGVKSLRERRTADAVMRMRMLLQDAPEITLAELAANLGYCEEYVRGMAKAAGITLKRKPVAVKRYSKLSSDKYEEIRVLRRTGKTLRQLAKQFGITYQMVSLICKGIKVEREPKLIIPKAELEQAIKSDPEADLKSLAAKFNSSVSRVRYAIQRYGLSYKSKLYRPWSKLNKMYDAILASGVKLTNNELYARLGVSRVHGGIITLRRRRKGLPTMNPKTKTYSPGPSPEVVAQVEATLNSGLGVTATARELGLKHTQVAWIRRKMKRVR
jgi:hypothetical protein